MNYNEILCQAVDNIVTNRLKDISFDKTIVCDIIDDKDSANGRYVVTDGSIKFDAYSELTKYRNGTSVYVTIPQGDYSNKKLIISKYTTDTENLSDDAYISPLETVVNMSDNLIKESIESSILANGSTLNQLLWRMNLQESNTSIDIQNNSIYNTLGISAKFKSNFQNKDLRQGNYGLRLDLFTDSSDEDYLVHSLYLDTADMFGDPYNFLVYFTQEKKFDISSLNTIWGMNLYLYQKQNFKYFDGQNLELQDYPTTYTMGDAIYPMKDNIFVTDINIFFGNDTIKIPDNTFEIYTPDSLTYSSNNDKKNIYSIWYNKNDNNEFIGFTDGVSDITYDEDTYQNEYETTMQGATFDSIPEGVPAIKEAISIYSNAELINTLLENIANRVDTDLEQILDRLEDNLIAYSVDNTIEILALARGMKQLLSEKIAAAAILKIDIDNESIPIETLYKDWLSEYNIIYQELLNDISANVETILVPAEIVQYYNDIQIAWNDLLQELIILYETTLLGYNNYENSLIALKPNTEIYIKKSYDMCKQIINYIKSDLAELDSVQIQQENLCTIVQQRLSNEDISKRDLKTFADEYALFIDKNANKYCIYWYRYKPGYQNTKDRYFQFNWERMIYPENKYPKPGMPSLVNNKFTAKSKVGWTNIALSEDMVEEKFMAVLFFNHIPYYSNILTFTNENPISTDDITDLINAVYIEMGYKSFDSYQLYGSHNQLLNGANALINRELRIRYNGIEEKDEALIDSYVYWYIPKNATMLTFNQEKISKAGFISLDDIDNGINDTELQDVSQYIKPGYYCFMKQITALDNKKEILNEADTYFYYLIKNYFVATAVNNNIICRIVKNGNIYEAEQHFNFSTFGTSGTDYTLTIQPQSLQTALLNIQGMTVHPLLLKAALYDYNNNLVQNMPAIGWSWLQPNANLVINETEDTNIRSIEGLLNRKLCLYNILECEAQWNKITNDINADQTLILKSYYPVPFSTGYYYIEGASTVIYDDLGKNPTYYKEAYKIYNYADNAEITDGITWEMWYYDKKGERVSLEETDTSFLSYMPKLIQYTDKEGYYLKPLHMFVNDVDYYPVVVCLKDDLLIWAQPIFITQNQHGSSMLNAWDESLTIDEKNGIILSTMLGAGSKDSENRFNGVLMGDVRTTIDNETLDSVGLYGFHQGVQSFGFKDDGTAFLGKSGLGRIEFNGDSGIIYSSAWDGNYNDEKITKEGTQGMAIHLREGHIDAHNFNLTTGYLTMSSTGNPYFQVFVNEYQKEDGTIIPVKNPLFNIDKESFSLNSIDGQLTLTSLGTNSSDKAYLRISTNSQYEVSENNPLKNLLCISNNSFYLQSEDYEEPRYDEEGGVNILGSGVRINLKNNLEIKAYSGFNLLSYSEVTGSDGNINQIQTAKKFIKINTDAPTYPLEIGKKFQVSWDGKINCSEAVITGGSLTIGKGFTAEEDEDGNIDYVGSGFSVDSKGNLICNNAIIQGKLINSELERPVINNVTINNGVIKGATQIDGKDLVWATQIFPVNLEFTSVSIAYIPPGATLEGGCNVVIDGEVHSGTAWVKVPGSGSAVRAIEDLTYDKQEIEFIGYHR